MHTRRTGRVMFAAAVGTIGLALAAPGVAAAAPTSASPSFVHAGNFSTFRIACGGSPHSASLNGTPLELSPHIGMQSDGGGRFSLRLRIPFDIDPATYHISMHCSNGNFGSARLTVSPHGGADTGDGATVDTATTTMTLVGGGAIAIAATGGAVLLLRRRRREPGTA